MLLKVMEITPEIAREWLKCNRNNRNARKVKVLQYKTDIVNGAWALNGESIKLKHDENGDLILVDGQHRLMAVMESGKSIMSVVVIDAEDNRYIDNGAPRSFADSVILCEDFKNVEKSLTSNFVVAIARVILNESSSSKYKGASNNMVKDFILSHADGLKYCYNAANRLGKGLRKAAIWAAVLSAYESGYGIDRLDNFVKVFRTGESLDETELAIVRLRNYCLTDNSNGSQAQKELYMKTQYALNAYLNGMVNAKCRKARTEYFKIKNCTNRGVEHDTL